MALNTPGAHTGNTGCWTTGIFFFRHWKNGEDRKLKTEGHNGWEIYLGTLKQEHSTEYTAINKVPVA